MNKVQMNQLNSTDFLYKGNYVEKLIAGKGIELVDDGNGNITVQLASPFLIDAPLNTATITNSGSLGPLVASEVSGTIDLTTRGGFACSLFGHSTRLVTEETLIEGDFEIKFDFWADEAMQAGFHQVLFSCGTLYSAANGFFVSFVTTSKGMGIYTVGHGRTPGQQINFPINTWQSIRLYSSGGLLFLDNYTHEFNSIPVGSVGTVPRRLSIGQSLYQESNTAARAYCLKNFTLQDNL